MTSCQAQTCTQHLKNIWGSIYQKLWGGWRRIRDGDGADVDDDDDVDIWLFQMNGQRSKFISEYQNT
jgi:hypothetical protein